MSSRAFLLLLPHPCPLPFFPSTASASLMASQPASSSCFSSSFIHLLQNEINPVISLSKLFIRTFRNAIRNNLFSFEASVCYLFSLINVTFNYILTTFLLIPDYSNVHWWEETPSFKLDAEVINRRWRL